MKRALVLAFASAAVLLLSHATGTRRQTATQAATARLDDRVFRSVVIGDSLARGTGDESRRGIAGNLPLPVTNLGIDGASTRHALSRVIAQRSALRDADAVIVSIGGNDLYGNSRSRLTTLMTPGLSTSRVVSRVQRLVREIHRTNPAAHVYVLGLYNPYRRTSLGEFLDRQVNVWDAKLIARFADDSKVTVIRIADLLGRPEHLSPTDRFHPGARGYASVAARIVASMHAAKAAD